MIVSDKLNTEFVCDALESLAREHEHASAELGAIELAAYSFIFIGTPRPPDERHHLRLDDTPPLKVVTEWTSLGRQFDEVLSLWKQEVARNATSEQSEFLVRIEADIEPESNDSGREIANRPSVEVLPSPQRALDCLKKLDLAFARESMQSLYVGLAVQALTFVIENGHVEALGTFLDESGKRHERYGDD